MNDLKKELQNEEIYRAWQANIAMSFYDSYLNYKEKKKYVGRQDMHKISNQAAKNFLNLMLK